MNPAFDGRQQVEKLRALYKRPNEIAPTGQGQGDKGALAKTRVAERDSSRLPADWRNRTPAPFDFYSNALPDLADLDDTGISVATCPLHSEPTTARMTVNLATSRGGWHCCVCGHGDMVSFVMRLHRIGFVAAVRHLVMEVAK